MTSGQSKRHYLILVVLLAILLRLIHFNSIHGTALIEIPVHADWTDMNAYWMWSGEILAGDWLGRETFHPMMPWMEDMASAETWGQWWGDERIFQQEPVYPYALAIGRLAGLSLTLLILTQLLIGALQSLTTFYLARTLFDDQKVAIFSALIAGIYGPLLFNQGLMLRDWLAPLLGSILLLACLKAANSNQPRTWLWPGILFGITLMAQSSIMLFLPLLGIWLAWEKRHELNALIRSSAFGIGGVLLGFSPLMLRNLLVGISPFSISNRLPEAIVEGNAEDNVPLGMNIPDSMSAILDTANGNVFVVLAETARTYSGDWVRFVEYQWLKVRAIVDPMEIPNNLSYEYGKEKSLILSLLPDFGWLLPAALTGWIFFTASGARKRQHRLLLLFLLAGAVALLAQPVIGRYRLILTTVLFLYAGFGSWLLIDSLQRKQFARTVAIGLAFMLIFTIQHTVIPVQATRNDMMLTIHPASYQASVTTYEANGEIPKAITEWAHLQARAEHVGDEPIAQEAARRQLILHLRIARQLRSRITIAESHLEQVDRLFDRLGDQTLRDYELGLANFLLGLHAKARFRMERFVSEHPDHEASDLARNVLVEIERIESMP